MEMKTMLSTPSTISRKVSVTRARSPVELKKTLMTIEWTSHAVTDAEVPMRLGEHRRPAHGGVPRSRMGRAGPRRWQAFRVPGARSGPGGAELVHRAPEARRVPPRVQRVRPGQS